MNENQTCQNCKKDFPIDSEDRSFYERMKVPTPTFCPSCRFQRRAVFRNERKLFKVKDAFTGADIFSLYPAEANRKVVTAEEWHGDSWSALDFGRDIDWSKPFLSQILELEKEIPDYNLNAKLTVNSPYSGNCTGAKNCYLCFNSTRPENCLYGSAIDFCTDCVDNTQINHCERCYENFWLQNCYQCYFNIMCVDSRNMWFSRDCLGCSDCFGCTNLRKSSYCIFNKQYTKEDYEKELALMELHTMSGIDRARNLTRAFWATQPTKYHQGLKNTNFSGSYVSLSKNVRDSWMVRESEDLRYCQNMLIPGNKQCHDVTVWGENTELCYETSVSGESAYNLKFCFNCWPACRDSEYCMHMFSSADCFGCVGMKSVQYCILNKQYTKEEYKELVKKIKEHMVTMPYVDSQGLIYTYGEFFPIEFSPFGYNNTIAQEHITLTEEEALKKGYAWIDPERGNYMVTKQAKDLPDSINNVSDEILKDIIECESCKRPYRIMPDELTFLRKEHLPLPQKCNDCRHIRRIQDRLKTNLYDRSCMCSGAKDETGQYINTIKHSHGETACGEAFKTGYSPESNTIVYCEACYQQETT